MQKDNVQNDLEFLFDDEVEATGSTSIDSTLAKGDYSTNMEELFSDDEIEYHNANYSDDEIEEQFLYTGKDVNVPVGDYREQMHDILGPDVDESAEDEDMAKTYMVDEQANQDVRAAQHDSSVHDAQNTEEHFTTFAPTEAVMPSLPSSSHEYTTIPLVTGHLHPSVSRLRSSTNYNYENYLSKSIQHFNEQSRVTLRKSSRTPSINESAINEAASSQEVHMEPFRWTRLLLIKEYLSPKVPDKAHTVLGTPHVGRPTVLAANGLICIGTDHGLVLLFDFQQRFKCICGDENSFRLFGPVTALALSHDHTFVAVGHGYGHIQLFDISKPSTPARTVNPITLAAVSSGRQEGHLAGSCIVQVGFIGGRNTAIASADDSGLAFYHSLGKMLFIEANDTLRILGKYPEEDIKLKYQQASTQVGIDVLPRNSPGHNAKSRPERQKRISFILAMAPLPLGTHPHLTDAYHLIAILTPLKLVVVGMSPSPKTWSRIHREGEDDTRPESALKGNLAWFPSVALPGGSSDGSKSINLDGRNVDPRSKKNNVSSPLLAYSWGPSLFVISIFETRTFQRFQNGKTGKMEKISTGRVNYRLQNNVTLENDIESIQWLNANQIFVATSRSLYVYDVRDMQLVERTSFDASTLVSSGLMSRNNGTQTRPDLMGNISQSFKAYKGKLFLLEYNDIKVGTLLTWADHVLSLVQDGDLLGAINLTRSYYSGEAKGNKNGLPENVHEMRRITGNRLRELMVASTRYILSEDRFTDATHVTPDNRGVDRTALFEGLVSTCITACIALDDLDFIFEDLFQWYDKYGILGIFMRQLEPFILDGAIHSVPPRITQKLISIHEDNDDLNAAERVIWHIDPECLDVNQAVQICQTHHLYDALVYVYTTALRDYVSPLVEFLRLIRQLQSYWSRSASGHSNTLNTSLSDKLPTESFMSSAFKVYDYLTHILTGLTYPSGKALPDDESTQAQKNVYEFLFYGRSSVWPVGNGGRVVLTADEDGEMEPTYPYVRLLLRFDAEAFLHMLDIVLESSYLNDEKQGFNRQIIIKVLLEITASVSNLTETDLSFLYIFLARNIPKYPQFIHVSPSTLQKILVELSSFENEESLEDRQLAAEYLLSVYTPHDMEEVLERFRKAGFFRILRGWYQQERKWALWLQSIFEDPALHDDKEIFIYVNDALASVNMSYKQHFPEDITAVIMKYISLLLHVSLSCTALLINQFIPSQHPDVLSSIGADNKQAQYTYLKCLLGPPASLTDRERLPFNLNEPFSAVETSYRLLYIELLCQFEPENSVASLQHLPADFLELEEILRICEKEEVYDAVIYKVNDLISPLESINKVEIFSKKLSREISTSLSPNEHMQKKDRIDVLVSRLQSITRMGLSLCLNHPVSPARVELVDEQLEDMWYKLLRSEIESAQLISHALVSAASTPSNVFPAQQHGLNAMRNLICESFTGLLSASSSKSVSFPGLFKRLVESTARSRADMGSSYTEFRTILTSMLESYRSEVDMVTITKHLVGRNIRENFEILTGERMKGRVCYTDYCKTCGEAITPNGKDAKTTNNVSEPDLVISPSGEIYHIQCLPSNLSTKNGLH